VEIGFNVTFVRRIFIICIIN